MVINDWYIVLISTILLLTSLTLIFKFKVDESRNLKIISIALLIISFIGLTFSIYVKLIDYKDFKNTKTINGDNIGYVETVLNEMEHHYFVIKFLDESSLKFYYRNREYQTTYKRRNCVILVEKSNNNEVHIREGKINYYVDIGNIKILSRKRNCLIICANEDLFQNLKTISKDFIYYQRD